MKRTVSRNCDQFVLVTLQGFSVQSNMQCFPLFWVIFNFLGDVICAHQLLFYGPALPNFQVVSVALRGVGSSVMGIKFASLYCFADFFQIVKFQVIYSINLVLFFFGDFTKLMLSTILKVIKLSDVKTWSRNVGQCRNSISVLKWSLKSLFSV